MPSASLTSTLNLPSAGTRMRPARISSRIASCSRSGTPKITYMGSVWVTVASSTSGPDTSVPSDTAARLVTPAMGDSTRVHSRSRRASSSRARAASTSAAATCSAESASS